MILEYEYLVGLTFNVENNFSYYINNDRFVCIYYTTGGMEEIIMNVPKEHIKDIELVNKSKLIIKEIGGSNNTLKNKKFISEIKKYYLYNKRKLIIENL